MIAMRVLIVKDGTVPVLVARVLASDGDTDELADRTGDFDLALEVFEVPDNAEALDVTWSDDRGYTVDAVRVAEWMLNRQADDTGGPIVPVDIGHFVQSDIAHSDDEHWYSHLFDLRVLK